MFNQNIFFEWHKFEKKELHTEAAMVAKIENVRFFRFLEIEQLKGSINLFCCYDFYRAVCVIYD